MAATSSLLSITSPGTQYIVTMTMKGTDRIDVIVNDGVENTGDLTITGLPSLSVMNIIGNGIRPKGKQLSTYVVDATTDMNGNAGSADITTYLYNNQDQQQVLDFFRIKRVYLIYHLTVLSAAVKGKAAGHGAMQTAGAQGAGSGTVYWMDSRTNGRWF